jgi:hypothetical protein
MGSRPRAPTRASAAPLGVASSRDGSPRGDAVTGRLPPCQARRCRRRFRTVATERTRTPSIGSTRALRPERARPRLLFTRVASPRTLSLAASPFCLVKGRQVASSYPALPRAAVPLPARRPRYTARKMRLTDFCNRLPKRAPCGSLDSRFTPCRAPSCDVSRPGAPAHPGPEPCDGEAREPAGRLPDEPTRWSFA